MGSIYDWSCERMGAQIGKSIHTCCVCFRVFGNYFLLSRLDAVHFHLQFLQDQTLVFDLLLHLFRSQLFDQFRSARGQYCTRLGVVDDVAEVMALEDAILHD